ncbi:hypothetical protein K439DRAFT_1352200, partial [Ramaria rubella]
ALFRDGYRCMISGDCDYASYNTIDHVFNMVTVKRLRLPRISSTRCTHIFSPSTSPDTSGEPRPSKAHNYAAYAWAVMERMGGVLPDELDGAAVHRLENILTLQLNVHGMFDSHRLQAWLEATVTSSVHCYFHLDESRSSAPHPRYLVLHAACVKVTHLSGAGEYIEKIRRDMESTGVFGEQQVVWRFIRGCVGPQNRDLGWLLASIQTSTP